MPSLADPLRVPSENSPEDLGVVQIQPSPPRYLKNLGYPPDKQVSMRTSGYKMSHIEAYHKNMGSRISQWSQSIEILQTVGIQENEFYHLIVHIGIAYIVLKNC